MNEDSLAALPDEPMDAAAWWCIRLSDGDMKDAEWAEFAAWRELPGNDALLQRAAAVWEACGGISEAPEIIPLRTEALNRYHQANRSRWGGATGWRWPLLAAIAATIVFAIALPMFLRGSDGAIYETAVGERRVAALVDGSRVTLDAASAVDVEMADTSRSLELRKGRARFDVAKDALRPFTVAVGDKLVVALGTSFSVELIGSEVRVILFEGSIEIRDRTDTSAARGNSASRKVLTAGQEFIDKVGTAAPGAILRHQGNDALGWEDGILSFEGETLARAVERMNRHAARPIRIADPQVGSLIVDGEFQAGDTEAFVEGVAAIHGVRVVRDKDETILSVN